MSDTNAAQPDAGPRSAAVALRAFVEQLDGASQRLASLTSATARAGAGMSSGMRRVVAAVDEFAASLLAPATSSAAAMPVRAAAQPPQAGVLGTATFGADMAQLAIGWTRLNGVLNGAVGTVRMLKDAMDAWLGDDGKPALEAVCEWFTLGEMMLGGLKLFKQAGSTAGRVIQLVLFTAAAAIERGFPRLCAVCTRAFASLTLRIVHGSIDAALQIQRAAPVWRIGFLRMAASVLRATASGIAWTQRATEQVASGAQRGMMSLGAGLANGWALLQTGLHGLQVTLVESCRQIGTGMLSAAAAVSRWFACFGAVLARGAAGLSHWLQSGLALLTTAFETGGRVATGGLARLASGLAALGPASLAAATAVAAVVAALLIARDVRTSQEAGEAARRGSENARQTANLLGEEERVRRAPISLADRFWGAVSIGATARDFAQMREGDRLAGEAVTPRQLRTAREQLGRVATSARAASDELAGHSLTTAAAQASASLLALSDHTEAVSSPAISVRPRIASLWGTPQVVVNIGGSVYGVNDLQSAIARAVAHATRSAAYG